MSSSTRASHPVPSIAARCVLLCESLGWLNRANGNLVEQYIEQLQLGSRPSLMWRVDRMFVLAYSFLLMVMIQPALTSRLGDAPSPVASSGHGGDPGLGALIQRPSTGLDSSTSPRRVTEAVTSMPSFPEAVPATAPGRRNQHFILRNHEGLRPSPSDPEVMTYEVSGGDSWESLARRFYGDLHYSETLLAANPGASLKSRPQPGTSVRVPIYESPGPASQHRVYRVQEGDTLSGISLRYYGTPDRWQEIFKENAGVLEDADQLKPGQELRIP